MAIEPSAEEIATFDNILAVANWAGMSEALLEEVSTVTGIKGSEHPRTIAAIAREDYEAVLPAMKMQGQPLSLGERSKVGLLYQACNHMCIVIPTRAREKAEHEAKLQLAAAQATMAVRPDALGSTVAVAPLAVAAQRTTKLSVVDQSNETQVATLTDAEVTVAFDSYHKAYGGTMGSAKRIVPMASQEPSIDQLSAMTACLKLGSCWADFSTFGPHGDRSRKEREFFGLTLGPEGTLVKTRLYGPASVDTWEACMAVLKNALIMLGAIQATALDSYVQHIRAYAKRYGPSCWALLYQADHRGRLEQIPRYRRQGMLDHAAARAVSEEAAKNCWYEPEAPWGPCFQKLKEDTEFWMKEFVEPAIMIASRAATAKEFLGGDAPIASAEPFAFSSASSSAGPARTQSKAPSQKKPQGQSWAESPAKLRKQVNVGGDGKYTTNRSGAELCREYNNGQCSSDGLSLDCPKHRGAKHQCWDCLGQHPAGSSECKGATAGHALKGKAKGGGKKGRGRGKG